GIKQAANAPFNAVYLLLGAADNSNRGVGTFDFSLASNRIDTLAANITGRLSLKNSLQLTVDKVNEVQVASTVVGVSTNGNNVSFVLGQGIQINQPIDTRVGKTKSTFTISALVGQEPPPAGSMPPGPGKTMTGGVHVTVAANLFAAQATF